MTFQTGNDNACNLMEHRSADIIQLAASSFGACSRMGTTSLFLVAFQDQPNAPDFPTSQ